MIYVCSSVVPGVFPADKDSTYKRSQSSYSPGIVFRVLVVGSYHPSSPGTSAIVYMSLAMLCIPT